MSTDNLLPPNATTLERRLVQSARALPAGVIPTLWNPDTCPAALLHILAWAESVDDWDPEWPEAVKRAVIKASRAIHRHKGTPAAIKRALAARGQDDALLIERYDGWRRDGSHTRNGVYRHGGDGNWATYKIVLRRPITADQAARLLAGIARVTRNCCHLVALDYQQAALRHNGAALRTGAYTRGVINIT